MGELNLQPVSLDRMVRAVEKVRERLLRVSAILDAHSIPYAVVGGNAVAAWVSRVDEAAVRNTQDVDVLIRREDLPRMIEVMEAEGFVHGKSMDVDFFLDGPDAKVRDAVHLLFAGEVIGTRGVSALPDVNQSNRSGNFRVLELEPLVEMKLNAWRDKDRMHLRDLISLELIDETWPAKYLKELGDRLQQLLDDPDG